MRRSFLIAGILLLGFYHSAGQNDISGPVVMLPVYFDVSPPLRDLVKSLPKKAETSWKDGFVKNKFNIRPKPAADSPGGISDPNLQITDGITLSDTTIKNFEGNSNTQGYSPPDTHGDIGPNHYFQVVNCHFSIYSRTGTLVLGPLDNSSIFNGMTNNSNDGDAVVLYDEQADRWLFSQFSLPSYPAGPFYQMIAVSVTGDPTGSWYRYQYSFTDMPDYPKFGVWPDAYYMSMHFFKASTLSYNGCGAIAYNRTLMLAGSPAATTVMFTKSKTDEAFGWLPSDCDGTFPSGNPPDYYLYTYDGSSSDHIGIYEFHVDWATTANSTFTNFLSLAVNSFTTNITGITQPGTTVQVDPLNDRMMYRLQFRNFGSYWAMVCNHTVDISTSVAGIRWYELRKTTGSWSIYQQGTYTPADNNSRWGGSIAMDSAGNIALGYSVSGSATYPSIRYTGRKKTDALNTMTLSEKGIITGAGSQTEATYHRWGDYSAMSCDPLDKANFWYTQEYYASTSSAGWKTRIAAVKIAGTPTLSTLSASAVTVSTATLNGNVNPNGLATVYHFEYGTTTGYGSNTSFTSAGSGSSAVAVAANISGLTTGATCHFRVVAANAEGTTHGDDLTVVPGGAVVTTASASSITQTMASSGGTITADGGSAVTVRGICWGISTGPVISGNHTSDGSGTGSYTSTLAGLSPATTYYQRAYATNINGTWYGNENQFSTLCPSYILPFSESFSSTTIPVCWSQIDHQGNGQIWKFGTITTQSPNPALTGNYAYLYSDAYGSGNTQNADLITPTLNLSTYSSVTLQFNHYFKAYTGSSGTVSYSINNGSTWTTIATFTGSANPAAFSQSIAAVAGQSAVKFKWNYTGTWGYSWSVDDIQVTGVCSSISPVSVAITPSANPVCAGTTVTLTATPANGGSYPSYQWKVNGSAVSGAVLSSCSFIPANADAVTCILTSSAACITGNPATSNTVTVTVNPVPAANFTAGNLTPKVNDTVQFTDLSTNSPVTWNWSFDRPGAVFVSGTTSASQNPKVKFTDGGLYTVTLQASTAACSGTAIKTAYIRAGIGGLWTGEVSSDWNNSQNWQDWLVPGASTDVVIPASAANWPVYNGDLTVGTHCKSLILSGPQSRLTVTGNLTYQ